MTPKLLGALVQRESVGKAAETAPLVLVRRGPHDQDWAGRVVDEVSCRAAEQKALEAVQPPAPDHREHRARPGASHRSVAGALDHDGGLEPQLGHGGAVVVGAQVGHEAGLRALGDQVHDVRIEAALAGEQGREETDRP
jgi:hypothetical protein